ncbi:GNAT family N-acetyltransferase [Candidatus Bathyarchaeota archaeon]|nr:MAG: GNAT family N-acetyltransferase [Candidatus Bathyarchaeota archaeon]
MKAGTIIRTFESKDGRKVTLRAPRWDDLDDMLEFINSLVEEGADIMIDTKQTRESEVEWLARLLTRVEKDETTVVAAEVEGRYVGQAEVTPRSGRSRHVGVLGIALKDGYREIGIGTELMREAETQARRLGLEIIHLSVFATNERARHVYGKVGYRDVGVWPRAVKKDEVYIDEIMMSKELSE